MTTPVPFRFDGHGINDANGQRIAKVSSCEPYVYPDGVPQRNTEFDALSYLIAAAPELLAVVKSILAMIDYCPDAKWFPDFDGVAFSRDSEAWKNAETAIAKAEGR